MTIDNLDYANSSPRRSRLTVVLWLLIAAGLVGTFYHNFAAMWVRCFPAWHHAGLSLYQRVVEGESYYTHGPLVPFISVIIALLLLRHTRIPVRREPLLGGLVIGFSLGVHLMASLAQGRVNFVSLFAFIGVLAGLVLLFWGRAALRRLWFPLAFLVFMVPLPEVTIAQINFRLKMFAAEIGVSAANFLGVVVERSGNRVFLDGGKTLIVANVCNGLRTLISVIAFGAIYAYVCRLRGGWRFLLFAMSVPVAVVANSIRIVALIVVADIWNERVATGWFHDMTGLLIFVLAFLMMFGIERLILALRAMAGRPALIVPLFADVRRGPQDRDQWSHLTGALGGRTALAVVVALAVCVTAVTWLGRPVASHWNKAAVLAALPRDLTLDGRTWHGVDLPMDDNTLTILENPDYLYRRYTAPGVAPVDLCVLFSRDNRKGIHPPDLCLEGAGEGIMAKNDYVIPDVPGLGGLPFRELVIQAGPEKEIYIYTYKCGGAYTRSFWRQQGTIFLNGLLRRDASGALIRLSTAVAASDADAETRRRLFEFVQTTVPPLDRQLH